MAAREAELAETVLLRLDHDVPGFFPPLMAGRPTVSVAALMPYRRSGRPPAAAPSSQSATSSRSPGPSQAGQNLDSVDRAKHPPPDSPAGSPGPPVS